MRAVSGQGGYPWSVERPQGEGRCINFQDDAGCSDYNSTIIGALELSEKKWVIAVQLPGVSRHSRHVLEACGDGLASFVERLKARCAAAGRKIARVILTHEAGRDGFWLARFLARRGIEVHVIQPSSLPVDRRARRAKTDIIDVEMLLRTLMAWLRGEPRVCSMVPIPTRPRWRQGPRPFDSGDPRPGSATGWCKARFFEADFQPGSFGYRPQRTAHEAVDRVARAIVQHKTRVIDIT